MAANTKPAELPEVALPVEPEDSTPETDETEPFQVVLFSDLNARGSKRAGEDLVPFIGKQIVIFSTTATGEGKEKKYSGDVQEYDETNGALLGNERTTVEFPRRVNQMLERVMSGANGRAVLTTVSETKRGVTLG